MCRAGAGSPVAANRPRWFTRWLREDARTGKADGDRSATHEAGPATIADGTLLLRHPTEASRGLNLTTDTAPELTTDGLTRHIRLPPRCTWTTEITAVPIVDDKPVQPRFRHSEPISETATARTLNSWLTNSTSLAVDDPRLATTLSRTRTDLGALHIDDPAHGGAGAFVAAGAPWRVAQIVLGMPGNLLLTEQSFEDYEVAMRYIFTARAAALLQN